MNIAEVTSAEGFKALIVRDQSNEDYHSGPGVSNSGLTKLARSPAHYKRQANKATKAKDVGTAIHTAILEPHRYVSEYVRKPELHEYPGALVTLADYKARAKELEIKGYSSATKDDLKDLIKHLCNDTVFFDDVEAAVTRGKTVLTPAEADMCGAIGSHVRSHSAVRKLLTGGEAEVSIYWRDEETGVLCRCRPDYLSPRAILDVKSTRDASEKGFARSIWEYRYWVQLAFYIDGVKAATGQTLPFVFLAFEKEEPFAVGLYAGDANMLRWGRREYKRLLRLYAECERAGEWPGYPARISTIALPPYAAREQEEIDQREAA